MQPKDGHQSLLNQARWSAAAYAGSSKTPAPGGTEPSWMPRSAQPPSRSMTALGSHHLPCNPPPKPPLPQLCEAGGVLPVGGHTNTLLVPLAGAGQLAHPDSRVPWKRVSSSLCLLQSYLAWQRAQLGLCSRALEEKVKGKTSDYCCTHSSSSDAPSSLIQQVSLAEKEEGESFPAAAAALYKTILHPWHCCNPASAEGKKFLQGVYLYLKRQKMIKYTWQKGCFPCLVGCLEWSPVHRCCDLKPTTFQTINK